MKKYVYALRVLILGTVIGFSGCGQSSDDDGSDGAKAPSYQFTSGSTVNFTLQNDENIIIGKGCTYADVYDSNKIKIGSTNAWASTPIPNPLSSGDYTASFSESYTKYTGSKGILYFKSSGFNIGTLSLNSNISVPDRTANIYQLKLNETSSFIVATNSSVIIVYDSNLNSIGTTNPWGNIILPDPLTLNTGTYYFVSTNYSCKNGGSFSVTEI
jgi:hypothetical protein